MKKIIAKIKKINNIKLTTKKLCIITFIISLIIISINYILNKVSPFGNISLLQVDFYHQYGPMLGELYDRIHNFSSLIYSFNMGMGLPLFRNYLNYMSSPFNIIMLFFKRSDLVTSYSVVIGLKAVMTSVSMVYYLSKKNKKAELYLISFGLIYAFSAYYTAYYWNLMWIDGMIYLPLITLGIEKIIDNGKWHFYTMWLAIMMLSNYYIGYMVCIFSCLYFLVYSISHKNLKKDKLKLSLKLFLNDLSKFAFGSIIAFGLIGIILIPLYFSISSISATGGIQIPQSQYYSFLVSDFLKYHFSGVTTTIFASDQFNVPNISCGILSLSLLLAFIVNVEVSFKEKISYIALLSFFLIAFFYPPLDYILHGFHVPNDLPYRYSFMYSFVLVLISFYSLKNIKKINYRMVMIIYIFLSLSLMVVGYNKWAGLSENMIYINMALLGIYFILYSLFIFKKINLKIIYTIMILITATDVTLSIKENFKVDQLIDNFYYDYDQIEEKLDYIRNNDDELFYRIEKTDTMTLNDSSWYNYYGITSFSSMNYENMAILQHNLGISGNLINSYIYKKNTPIYDTMFDIKYLIGNINDNTRYTSLEYNDINKNDYHISLAYGVSKNLLNWKNKYDDPFIMQNEYLRLATGISDVLVKIDNLTSESIYTEDDFQIIKYTFKNNNYDNLYFYTDVYNFDFAIINDCLYYNGGRYNNYPDILSNLYYNTVDYSERHIVNFTPNKDTITIYIGYNNYYLDNFELYTINQDKLKEAINKLRNNKLNITSFKETKITGNIELENDMLIYTSIPYDQGWHAYVDGKEVETKVVADTLLAFNAPRGKHEIVIRYKINGLFLGCILSILSIIQITIDKFFISKKNNSAIINIKE